MPYIYIDVGVRSQGVIRPVSEIKQIISLVPGRLELIQIRMNDHVQAGDLIARISSPVLDEKLDFNQLRGRQVQQQISDLSGLLQLDSASVFQNSDLHTARYNSSWLETLHRLKSADHRVNIRAGELSRIEILAGNQLVSKSIYDEYLNALKTAISDYHLILEQQKNQWQIELHIALEEFDQLVTERKQLERERDLYHIRSPETGTVQHIAGITSGSYIYTNQVIAEITPDTTLIVEVYVNPGDIGLIIEQMDVRMQVTAFNSNQWGVLRGQVTDISQDVVMINTMPLFRVRCTPDKSYLTLSNGYRGQLKKGMTVQARFIVARRNLLQLLYDKVDDWINPVWGNQDNPAIAST